MKLNLYFLIWLGTIASHANALRISSERIDPFSDYHLIDSPIAPVEETIDRNPIDLNTMFQDFVLETKKISIEGHPFAFNPSIVRWQGSLLLSFRTYNPITRSTNPFALVWLDEDFNPASTPQIFELPFKNPILASKQQDPRLVTVGDRLFVVYNNILENITEREMRRMYVSELFYDGSTFSATDPQGLTHFEGVNEMRYEKNWVPFDYNGKLHLGYSVTPHKIFQPILGTPTCKTVSTTEKGFKWNWGVPRGGTQAVLDGNHYLGFFHSWVDVPTLQSNGKKLTHYMMGAYTFESKPPFNILSVSPEPIVAEGFYDPPYYKTWKPLRCVFPAGLVVDENYAWLAYGRQDHEMWIAKIDKKKLLKTLVPTTP